MDQICHFLGGSHRSVYVDSLAIQRYSINGVPRSDVSKSSAKCEKHCSAQPWSPQPTDVQFGVQTRVRPWNYVSDGVDPHAGMGSFGWGRGIFQSILRYK